MPLFLELMLNTKQWSLNRLCGSTLTTKCRICGEEKANIPIFNDKETLIQQNIGTTRDAALSLAEEIFNFSGVEILQSDKLPKRMCRSCYRLLNNCIQFRELCQRTNETYVNELCSNTNENKESIEIVTTIGNRNREVDANKNDYESHEINVNADKYASNNVSANIYNCKSHEVTETKLKCKGDTPAAVNKYGNSELIKVIENKNKYKNISKVKLREEVYIDKCDYKTNILSTFIPVDGIETESATEVFNISDNRMKNANKHSEIKTRKDTADQYITISKIKMREDIFINKSNYLAISSSDDGWEPTEKVHGSTIHQIEQQNKTGFVSDAQKVYNKKKHLKTDSIQNDVRLKEAVVVCESIQEYPDPGSRTDHMIHENRDSIHDDHNYCILSPNDEDEVSSGSENASANLNTSASQKNVYKNEERSNDFDDVPITASLPSQNVYTCHTCLICMRGYIGWDYKRHLKECLKENPGRRPEQNIKKVKLNLKVPAQQLWNTHFKGFPFQCDICKHKFKTKKDLKLHFTPRWDVEKCSYAATTGNDGDLSLKSTETLRYDVNSQVDQCRQCEICLKYFEMTVLETHRSKDHQLEYSNSISHQVTDCLQEIDTTNGCQNKHSGNFVIKDDNINVTSNINNYHCDITQNTAIPSDSENNEDTPNTNKCEINGVDIQNSGTNTIKLTSTKTTNHKSISKAKIRKELREVINKISPSVTINEVRIRGTRNQNNKIIAKQSKPKSTVLKGKRSFRLLEVYTCYVCTMDFTGETAYNEHLQQCMKENPEKLPEYKLSRLQKERPKKKPMLCDICGQQLFVAHALQLQMHMTTHSNVFPFHCDICPYKGRTKNGLVVHIKSHLDVKDRTHPCRQCSYKANNTSNLKAHIRRRHSDERPCKCPLCEKPFKDEYSVRRHINYFHKRESAECDICLKTYTKKFLNRHKWVMHKIKPYKSNNRRPAYLLSQMKENELNHVES